MNLLILSPYPENGTKNSGDDLIVGSLIELIEGMKKKDIDIDVISIAKSTLDKEKTFKSIDIKKYNKLLVPGFRVSVQGQEILDIRLKYIESAIMNNIPVFLIGSSWCVFPGTIEQTKYKIDPKEKALIKYVINDKKSCITSRDKLTQLFLKNNNINCEMTGDLGLYSLDKINTEFQEKEIKKVSISLPHNSNWYQYCRMLKTKIEKSYKIDVKICTHQYLGNNKSYKDLSGSYKNLDFYKNIDLHIGFRLHGHIWFIRNRKPSILIAEDGRSSGYLETFNDTGIHASPQYILNNAKKVKNESILLEKLNRNTKIDIPKIMKILKTAINNKFTVNKETCNQIDFLWKNKMKKIIFNILEVEG
jgi:polysaccharide pyruvyl transferase WcaK-like protein